MLSRSTRIRPTLLENSLATSNIPSNGQAPNPQLFAVNTGHGKKRKRGSSDLEKSVDVGRELNFFQASAGEGIPFATQRGAKKLMRGRAQPDLMQEEPATINSQAIPSVHEQECRRMLKSHKIKIMDLDHSGLQSIEVSSTKKSKKAKKPVQHQLSKKKQREASRLYPQPVTSFAQLQPRYHVSNALSDNICRQGYTLPTEVQLAALPLLMKDYSSARVDRLQEDSKTATMGLLDLLTVAPTGSGKTLAFLIPLINFIGQRHRQDSGPRAVCALIVAPTKELVVQTVNEGRKLTMGTGVRITAMRKGMNLLDDETRDRYSPNDAALLADDTGEVKDVMTSEPVVKSDILVTTPLQLVNALKTGSRLAQLPSVQYVVLDEADVLLDSLFRDQTMDIWNACIHPRLRVSLWSATMGSNIEELTKSTISRRRVALGLSDKAPLIRVVVGLKDTAIPNVSHQLVYAATEQGKLMGLRQLLHPTSTTRSAINRLRAPFLVFTQTISRAIALNSELAYDVSAEAGGSARISVLHSDLSDTQRSDIMARFRKGDIWILITTDLLSRGVDFRGINGIVNYDIPNSSAAYVHRVGRTGRAGRAGGVAVTLYTKEDIPYVKNIANVVAASETVRGEPKEGGMQKWLLDALPDISKKDRKELKQKGIGIRRNATSNEVDGKVKRRSRISTKSGYERRVEHARKGAAEGSRRREEQPEMDNEEWAGFDV